jgi:4'-phosphopantetheinyl transferase
MAVELFETGVNRTWALWRISENEETLGELLTFREEIPANLTNREKRLEWIAGRVLTQSLLENFGIAYQGIIKDDYGKPFLRNSTFHISLSHSYPFVAAILDRENAVGIDLEQPKEKLLRIAPRVLSPTEFLDAGEDVNKHCIYWCAKEALIKIYGKKDLTLAKNLRIEPFLIQEEGNIIGRIIVDERERLIPLYYRLFPKFAVVFNSEK